MDRTLVITVSGIGSGAGKTRLIEKLIPCLRNCAAIKARRHEGANLSVVVEDDSNKSAGKDTGRFLSAGARRAYLITGTGAEVRRAVEEIIAGGEFDVVVVESNEVAMQLERDLSFFVKGEGEAKPGADAYEERADVVVQGVSQKREEMRCRRKKSRE